MCFHCKILQQIETLRQCPKCCFHQKCESPFHFVILTFFIVVFVDTITCSFALFLLVTIDVVYVNSVRFKHIDSSCHFLELNDIGCNLIFKLKQLLLDSDIQSNPGHTQNDCKSSVRRPVKIKMLKGTKKCDLSENNVNVASDPRLQNCFSNTIHLVTLDIIKSWSVTCASTPKSLQKSEFKVNNDINQNVSYYQGDITKLA